MSGIRHQLARIEKFKTCADHTERVELVRAIVDLFFATADQLDPQEKSVFGTALTRVAFQLQQEARAEISRRMAHAEAAPRELMIKLAHDAIAVARPVLEHCTCLTTEDLISIARTQSQMHLLAISRRPGLETPLTDAIIGRGNDTVLTKLAENPGARFSDRGLTTIAVRAEAHDALKSALMARPDVPQEFIIRAVRVQKPGSADAEADADPDADAIAFETDPDEDMAPDEDILDAAFAAAEAEALAEAEAAAEECEDEIDYDEIVVSERALLNYLRDGPPAATIACFAALTRITRESAGRCIRSGDMKVLAALCKANGLGKMVFSALVEFAASQSAISPLAAGSAPRRFENMSLSAARRIVQAEQKSGLLEPAS